jgi:hypothetical protein
MDWQIYVLDIATGVAEIVWDDGMFPTWSPDDASLAFLDRSRNKLAVLDLATGALTRFRSTGSWPDWRR